MRTEGAGVAAAADGVLEGGLHDAKAIPATAIPTSEKQTKPLSPDRDRSMRGPLGEDDRYEEAAANPEYQDLLAEDDPEFAEFLRAYRAGDTNSA